MTDYYEPQYPNYAPHHQPYYADPDDENEIRRTATRGSHQSQATASTKSWVQQTQRHPPPPPPGVEDLPPQSRPASQGTPFHGPRPLPERHISRRPPTQYVQHVDDEDGTDDIGDDPMVPGALRFGYQSDDMGNGRPILAGPSTLGPSTPMLASTAPLNIQHKKTFVGGFFKGLKKIPKIVLGRGEKGGLRRRGTFGTDGTTLTAVSHGNTLPRYLSNPSIGPSNPQFAHRLSMAVANGSLPPEATPAVFQMRTNPQPRYPEVVVTPPSAEGVPGESVHAEFYDGPPPEEEPEYQEQEESHTDPRERTTVMVYNTDSQAPTVTQGPSSQPTRPPSAPRVSYPAELPTRQNTQSQSEHFNPLPPPMPPPPLQPGPSSAILHPSPRYAAPHPNHVGRHREQLLSPITTSGADCTSTSGLTSYYDPSFASDLGPIEKFFKGLYHLPWIGRNRITVDYRPGDTARAKGKMRVLKNPKIKPSWYRSMMGLSRRNSLDLLSSEGAETMSPRSFGNTLSRFGSPLSRRSGRSSERRHHHHHNHHHHSSRTKHRHRRRRTATSAATTTDVPHRVGSPIVPTVYPYAVPPYLPYTYPYMPYATMPMPESSPRGQRSKTSRRAAKYPHGGYTAYQPMAMPPPPVPAPMQPAPSGQALYYMGPSPPQSQNSGDASAMAGQPMMQAAAAGVSQAQGSLQFSSPMMHYVPAPYAQNLQAGTPMISPPISPQRPKPQHPS
ncbi:unnamed protein product [Cyclocybe aegerita]|uniref:Uncharacterized protein n=1 Tax=Cyclocybe aegerita TaxID=1973307 RepID=A0A8S0WIL1_CYCAE|nr:unnamed protein product [Cyclocybe aegerita]